MKPYQDLEQDDYVIREFDQNIDPIPWDLEPKMSLIIQRHDYHRVIKGKGNLLIKIHKIKD